MSGCANGTCQRKFEFELLQEYREQQQQEQQQENQQSDIEEERQEQDAAGKKLESLI